MSSPITKDNKITYTKPPVIEVVLSAQFARIPGFNSCHLGGLQKIFAAGGYKAYEEHPPLQASYEQFGIQLMQMFPMGFEQITDFVPRVWFKTPDDAFVVQIQPNRIICNWRKNSRHLNTRAMKKCLIASKTRSLY